MSTHGRWIRLIQGAETLRRPAEMPMAGLGSSRLQQTWGQYIETKHGGQTRLYSLFLGAQASTHQFAKEAVIVAKAAAAVAEAAATNRN